MVVGLDDQGERSFTFMVKPSADQFMSVEDIPNFKQGDWLHVCSISLANEPSRSSTFEAIKRAKPLVVSLALTLTCVMKCGKINQKSKLS